MQQLTSVHALAQEVFRINRESKNQVRIDPWLGCDLTQTLVRADSNLGANWLKLGYETTGFGTTGRPLKGVPSKRTRSVSLINFDHFFIMPHKNSSIAIEFCLWCNRLQRFFKSGGSPYPRMDGRKVASLLQQGYRMPKPQHVDDKL